MGSTYESTHVHDKYNLTIRYIRTISKAPVSVDYMYRMVRLLSTLPVGKDMEQLLNYYFNIMLMSASV